jgi:Transcriptional regulation of mitochondrial recombination
MYPRKIRKDLWIPLVHAIFPDHLIANKIYKKLLDYRAWRLTSPPTPAQMLLSKKRRNAEAKNQVPTSIADLAHVTKEVPGRMIMNWHHFQERHWARGWAANIYHSPKGFDLVNGYKLQKYTFPKVTAGVRRKLGWEESTGEPPRNLKEAVEQHTRIYGAMHRGMKRKRKVAVRRNALVAKRGKPNLKKRAARTKQIRKRGFVGR